jgi:hypothetical protein
MEFFMLRANKAEAGMSIIEIVIGLGIFGIFATASFKLYTDFTEHQWAARNQMQVKNEVGVATAAINKYFPGSIVLNSTTNPVMDSNIWQCVGGACSLRSDNRQDGIELVTSCESTQQHSILKKLSFENLSTLKAEDNCAICGVGERPKLDVVFYRSGVESGRLKFPKSSVTAGKVDGLVGMSLCFSVPARATAGGDVFDQWVVSLVPIYFSGSPKASDATSDLTSKFRSVRETLLLGPMEQLGSKIKVIK